MRVAVTDHHYPRSCYMLHAEQAIVSGTRGPIEEMLPMGPPSSCVLFQ